MLALSNPRHVIDILIILINFSFKTAKKVRSLNHFMTLKLNSFGIVNVVEIPNRVSISVFN